jgi:tRNA(Arg) A34 adenosine deaminase TadA
MFETIIISACLICVFAYIFVQIKRIYWIKQNSLNGWLEEQRKLEEAKWNKENKENT